MELQTKKRSSKVESEDAEPNRVLNKSRQRLKNELIRGRNLKEAKKENLVMIKKWGDRAFVNPPPKND